jgi:hypothetical protein
VRPGELDDCEDILHRLGKSHCRGSLVDDEVPGLAGEIPILSARQEHASRETVA